MVGDGDSPYRVAPQVIEPPRDTGIVGDVIGQFADPFAFYRELVQNAIDAGSRTIEVRIEYDEARSAVRASVRDTGEGMTKEIVEDQLLVLFRSTKEHDDTKIGKFGIGFASVLSPQPTIVVVQTSRGGRRHTLYLHRDLSYELFDAGPATKTGTTVELDIPLALDGLAEFVTASRAALIRWCRHATVPIRLVARHGATAIDERIDRPLGLDDAVVEAHVTSEDGLTTAVVGITTTAGPYAGFFDHGLTLWEGTWTVPALGRVAFKVQDSRLAHTISRDNVRRDDAYDRAIAFVARIVRNELLDAAVSAVRVAAEAGDRERYATLTHAIGAADLAVTDDRWWHRTIEPIDGRLAFQRDELTGRPLGASALGGRPLGASHSSPITRDLAAAGVPVVDLGDQGRLVDHAMRRLGTEVAWADQELVRIAPVDPTPADRALLDAVEAALVEACGRVGTITLADLEGAVNRRLVITADRDDAFAFADDVPGSPWLIERKRTTRRPFGLFRRPPIVISAGIHQVQAARELAETDAAAAGGLLARLILVTTGALDAGRSQRLLDHTLAQLGIRT